jgi:hypothetical protein
MVFGAAINRAESGHDESLRMYTFGRVTKDAAPQKSRQSTIFAGFATPIAAGPGAAYSERMSSRTD